MKIKFKKILLFITCLMLFFIPLRAEASSKEMTFGVEDTYSEITFRYSFDSSQYYSIEITSPSGEKFYKEFEGNSTDMTVYGMEKGDYQITVIAENDFEVSTKAECRKGVISDTGSGITLATSLTDVRFYFYDNTMYVSWADTGMGKVSVKVTNPSTMQNIASAIVDKTSWSVYIPEGIEEIMVSLVPTVSAKIDGAASNYTLSVVRGVDGEVVFDDTEVTNKNDYIFKVKSLPGYKVVVFNNNKMVFQSTLVDDIEHEVSISLVDTENELVVYLEDDKGNLESYSKKIFKDLVAPTINLTEDFDGKKISKDSLVVSGYVNDGYRLYINGVECPLEAYGEFSKTLTLTEGSNSITIVATDFAGNSSSVTMNVEKTSFNPLLVLIPALGILIVMVVLIIKSKLPLLQKEPSEGREVERRKVERREVPKEKPERKREDKKKSKPVKTVKRKDKSTLIMKYKSKKGIGGIVRSAFLIFTVWIVFGFMIKTTRVASSSMEPTLMTGDIVIFNQLAYAKHDIERGDIICFDSIENKAIFSKRVIGVAGDVISFKNGYLYINDEFVDETDYLDSEVETNSTKTFTVPEGYVFVLGDNRELSYDSRFWNEPFVNVEDVYGKYLGSFRLR